MEREVTFAPGCEAAEDGQHEFHWFVVPALYVNSKLRKPAGKRGVCWKCDQGVFG